MFNLNEAIAAWRRQMLGNGITSVEVLDELESHVRDDVEEQVRAGVDTKAAFDSAIQRIGPAVALKREFAKSGPPQVIWHGNFWRNFYYCSTAIAILVDAWTFASFELSLPERAAGVCVVAVFAWYLLRLPFLRWWSGGIARKRFLSAMKLVAIIGPIWVLLALLTALRVVHIEIGIIPAMIMWSLCAAYVFTGLVCGLNNSHGSDGGSAGWLPPLCPVPSPNPPAQPCRPDFNIPIPPANAFTPLGGKVLELAREEALRLGHDFIGTEHLLLGVLRIAGGALAQVLESSQVESEAVRREIERLVSPLPAHHGPTLLRLTPRARKALQFADTEAAALKRPLVSPEHVLLGLLKEGGGVAAVALNNLGVQLKCVRAELSATRAHD